ncbi:shikimate dehydrogenase family protein [Aspergillus thermomutatus]|uniref:Shikimate dehydrogenase substrate binding N-terminal domain-containing protein n=1 Tax=Aspergillus thermomutatus TaxID=41047 RepID=A0A397HK62_ASPTH|nr:uncharacterized protein CDV56_109302 [Aspergillus thermomutatus]RHZ63475.1 hypothetical protein CDV56_109302 [Aspergillus thermomutatus]
MAPAPKNFYIFGSGISFSISPTIHHAGFSHHNLPHTYQICESKSIDDVATLIADDTFGGGSVTMPHKLTVHRFCDTQTETARLIGAINTLLVTDAGAQRLITGDNTDWSGLHTLITEYTSRTQHQLQAGLVIGAGGASRAALFALHKAGVRRIYLVNRTPAVAEKVRNDFSGLFEVIVVPSLGEFPHTPDVIVGTVPAETTTEEQFACLFGDRGLCIDMSYKPRQTPLLTVAQRHEGWVSVTGVEVLLAQAFDQFRLWTGLEPPREKMVEAVMAREGRVERSPLGVL